MAGTNNRRGAVMEDWMLSTPSPRTLMLSLFNDDFSSGPFSDVSDDSGSNKPHDEIERSKASIGSSPGESSQVTKTSIHFEPNLFGANEKSGPDNGSPAERNGFCALKIDTSRVGFSASIRSPIIIPPGVSPRELLESPVFLPNAIAQPSPTTGKLPFLMRTNANTTIPSVHKKTQELSHDDHTISFQQILRSKPTFSFVDKGPSVIHQNQPSASENNHRIPDNEQEDSKANRNGDDSPATIIVRAEDGYNWRKYGKKQVKNRWPSNELLQMQSPKLPCQEEGGALSRWRHNGDSLQRFSQSPFTASRQTARCHPLLTLQRSASRWRRECSS